MKIVKGKIQCILPLGVLIERACADVCFNDFPCILIIEGISDKVHEELLAGRSPVAHKICGYNCPNARNTILANKLGLELIQKLKSKECHILQSCLPDIK